MDEGFCRQQKVTGAADRCSQTDRKKQQPFYRQRKSNFRAENIFIASMLFYFPYLADFCYSGASGGRTISLAGIRANISDAFLDRITAGRGKVILTASGANEVSEENDNLGHGVFTYYLLEGLRGSADTDQDGLITVDEVYRYVSRRVPEATNQEQNPVKKGTTKGQLVLSVVK